MEKDRTYNVTNLLEDDRFISSVNHPSPESDAYRNALLSEGKITRDDCDLAMCFIRSLHPSHRNLSADEIADMWDGIRMRSKRLRNRNQMVIWLSTVAAGVAVAVGMFAFYTFGQQETPPADTLSVIENVARPDSAGNDIRIVFSDNNQVALKEKTAEITYNETGEAKVSSRTVAQSVEQDVTNENTYNQVIVPKGKHACLTLSDGSKLYLNASSRVVYPPVFGDDRREIYVEGEAYADVVPDSNRPFVLKTKRMEIRVMGTAFNVSAYDDEISQTVVLVRGSVSVKTKENPGSENMLHPNQMFKMTGGKIQLANVNVDSYVSWKDGFYLFREESFSFIIKRLSHYYGIDIRFEPEIGDLRFTGKLDLKDDPARVLSGISKATAIPVSCRKENEVYYLSMNP
ncbi:MAG: FecR domain-containing protein [Tannerella sp.]|nr:FecR domain-containing protein [Tannerella sp.]